MRLSVLDLEAALGPPRGRLAAFLAPFEGSEVPKLRSGSVHVDEGPRAPMAGCWRERAVPLRGKWTTSKTFENLFRRALSRARQGPKRMEIRGKLMKLPRSSHGTGDFRVEKRRFRSARRRLRCAGARLPATPQ